MRTLPGTSSWSSPRTAASRPTSSLGWGYAPAPTYASWPSARCGRRRRSMAPVPTCPNLAGRTSNEVASSLVATCPRREGRRPLARRRLVRQRIFPAVPRRPGRPDRCRGRRRDRRLDSHPDRPVVRHPDDAGSRHCRTRGLRDRLLRSPAVDLHPVDVHVADAYFRIDRGLLRDPWDRLIVATAMALALPLVTRDGAIKGANLVETLW